MHETPFDATPYDVDVTPNGLIAVVRGNNAAPANLANNDRVSFWRTDVTSSAIAQILPSTSLVGRGLVTTLGQAPTFSNAIAVNNERAVIIGSADTDFDNFEDTTYVDIVAFDYTQSPPLVNVVSSTALGSTASQPEWAGLAHDVAITPDGTLAVVSHRNWIHVFELMTGTVVKAFHVGGSDSPSSAGPCDPGFSRNSLEVTNQHAVVTMARSVPFPNNFHTWVYVVDLTYSPPTALPTLILEDELVPTGNDQQKPHDLAISPDGTLAGISSFNTFGLYHLAPLSAVFLDGDYNGLATKESLWDPTVGFCGHLWDSIEMSDDRAIVYWNRPELNQQEPPCPFDFRWTLEVFDISNLLATSLGEFSDTDLLPAFVPSFNSAWDISLSDDGGIVAVGNFWSNLALVDVDTATPQVMRFWGYGSGNGPPSPTPPGGLPSFSTVNDTVAITQGFVTPSLPSDPPSPFPNTHRWIAFLRSISTNNNPFVSTVALYDLPQYLAGNPQEQLFVESAPGLDTIGADLALNRSQTEVLTRRSAPPDELNPAAGGRDWSGYFAQAVPPTQTGITLGGSGLAVGVDNLVQRRGVAVSIAADAQLPNRGFVHVTRAN